MKSSTSQILTTIWTYFLNAISWLIIVTLSPIVALIVTCLMFWKFVIIESLAKLWISKDLKRLDPFDCTLSTDAFWEKPLGSLGYVLILEGEINVPKFCKFFSETILEARNLLTNVKTYEKLLQIPRLFGGYYFWESASNFQFQNHIKIISEPVLETQISAEMCNLISSPFPKGQPLWEIIIFTNVHDDANNGSGEELKFPTRKSALSLRISHICADGYTYAKLMDKIIGHKTPEFVAKDQKSISVMKKIETLINTPRLFLGMISTVWFSGDVFSKRKKSINFRASCRTLSLEKLKVIRKLAKVHFSTIGIYLLGKSLNKFLNSSSPQGLNVMLPLPRPGHPNDRMANHWTMGIIEVSNPNNASLSATVQLHKLEQNLVSVMSSGIPILIQSCGPQFLSLLPNPILRNVLRRNIGTGIIFSSIPGPNHNLYLGSEKQKILKIIPTVGTQFEQTGIMAIFHAYNGDGNYSICANEDICSKQKDVELLGEILEQEVDKLLHEIQKSNHVEIIVE